MLSVLLVAVAASRAGFVGTWQRVQPVTRGVAEVHSCWDPAHQKLRIVVVETKGVGPQRCHTDQERRRQKTRA